MKPGANYPVKSLRQPSYAPQFSELIGAIEPFP